MEKLYIGLDIGTNSAGIACSDENYNLVRAKGKDCWATRLFDEASTAADRRVKRTARRRLARRKQRISYLQEVFSPFISDKLFFIRLKNSQLLPEDKEESLGGDKNSLFADIEFNDKEFHKKFPTIYHWRKYLQTADEKDIRLYYLALHHIIKYSGHFLFEGEAGSDFRDCNRLFKALESALEDLGWENKPSFDSAKIEDAKVILLDGKKRLRDKQSELERLFGIADPSGKEIIKGICGAKFDPKKLFPDQYKEEKSFSLAEMNEETFEALQATYGDDFLLLEAMRSLYNYFVFERLLKNQSDISSAMIAVYEKHKSDLKRLKKFLRKNCDKETYKKMFSDNAYDSVKKTGNYANYVGFTKERGKKVTRPHAPYEGFLEYLKKFLNELSCEDVAERDAILSEVEEKSFLPQILHSDNGLIPNQINKAELEKIVRNMVRNLPETAEMAEKIKPIFEYRIPYYVGPLSGTDRSNCWMVKKPGMEGERITPWNFDEVVDKAASNEEFMRRMTNKCTYLHAEDVLPKGSVYYQKYDVLNQLNTLLLNGQRFSLELKQEVFNNLFLVKKNVTVKSIKDYLVRSGRISESEKSNVQISGEEDFKASMSSYLALKSVLGDFVDRDYRSGGRVCEDIILWHTLNTDKNVVIKLIENKYGSIPEIRENMGRIKGLVFKDFGRFSERFLTGLRVTDPESGENLSILDLLYETQMNLNEILFDERFGFMDMIREENGEESAEITKKDIDELYVSPAVKRGIHQSLKMVDEYVAAIGKMPDKIFVEVTRGEEKDKKGKKTESRKSKLQKLYKNLEGIDHLVKELEEIEEKKLKSERLYLYFRQLGKCMYSGKEIDIRALSTDQYDVDHILPRCYIKDDSLDNKVLVLRSKNEEKRDIFPLPKGLVSEEARKHWELLRKKNMIGGITYERLTRVEPLTEGEYQDFINRQRTITDQTAKAVAELLKRKYKDSKIVYSRAKNVSDFRNKFGIHKCRETNDLHHARDAYLNIVVGNVYDVRFSTPQYIHSKVGDEWREYNLKKLFERDVKGAWIAEGGKTITNVKKVVQKTSMCVTRYAFCNHGKFYDETVYGKGDTGIREPRKKNLPMEKYGGFSSLKTAYFAIVLSKGKKGKEIKTIEAIPVLWDYRAESNPSAIQTYLESYLKDPKILIPRIKVQQLIKYNGEYLYIAGISGSSGKQIKYHNAVECFTDNKTDLYVKDLGKFSEAEKTWDKDEYMIQVNRFGQIARKIDREQNLALYDWLIEKLGEKMYGAISAFKTVKTELESRKEKFKEISLLDQAKTLLEVFKFLKCDAAAANLKAIDGSAQCGIILTNKDITNIDFRLIHQSPCGLIIREEKV